MALDSIIDTNRLRDDAAYKADMRHRFITDHFFAAWTIGFRDFSERAHRPAVKLYFPKNPNVPIIEQRRKKKYLHMDPRKTFKTTLNRVDSVQWVCAFPEEITILNESATQPLSAAISKAGGFPFFKPVNEPPTPFQCLWDDLCLHAKREPGGTWDSPLRRRMGAGDMDSTSDYTSPLSTQSGWHPFVKKSDDLEDTENSGIGVADSVRRNVIDKADQNENLIRDGGYSFTTGTRYHPFDYYLDRAKRNPDNWEVLVRCSIKRKDGSRLMPGIFPPEDECELQFPEFMSLGYKALEEIFYSNYESFMCQQQNDPQGGHVSRFDERVYDSSQIAPGRIPRNGDTFVCWRPKYGGDVSASRNAEGAAARIIDGRVYVLDAWQGGYTPTGEAEKIVAQCREHDAAALLLVEVPGSDYVGTNVRNELLRRNSSVRIQWVPYAADNDQRTAEIEQLEPLMKAGRLLFSSGMGRADQCRKQFVHFGLIEENGIIECISKFAAQVPLSLWRANMQEEELEYMRRRREDALLSHFMEQSGLDAADEELRQKTEGHLDSMSGVANWVPPLPGGLDG
jgi:hypothetical protein